MEQHIGGNLKMTTQSFTLNLIPYGIKPIIHVSQFDTGQTWIFNLKLGNEYYQIPAEASISIQGTLKDGTTFNDACSYSGHQITATETGQMTRLFGDVPAEIRIIKGDAVIGTLNFIIRVEKAA